MMKWIRANGDRIVLGAAGMVTLVVAAAIRDRGIVASPLGILGVAVFVLAVILPRVQSFSVGVKGISARLERLERKVDQIIRPATLEAPPEVFPPTNILMEDPPPPADSDAQE